MERPQCCIDRCLTKTKSIKVKDIIYYLFPTDKEWANKWDKRIKEFDPTFRRKSNDIVCSLHFAKTSMKPVSRQLVDHALPIYFPQKISETTNLQNKPPTKPESAKCAKLVMDSTSGEEQCCINGCPTKYNGSESKIPVFKFPMDPEQRKKWTFLIELYNSQTILWKESLRICALHFAAGCFDKPDQLSDGAKPSVFKNAVLRRQMEIEKQQAQAKEQRTVGAIKTQSINVPIHKANAVNQSMTQRSAPGHIVARRLSLPYKQLPTLLPKPNVLKRIDATKINGPNGVINVHRINARNLMVSSPATKNALRPVPALNKVVNISNVTNLNVNHITTTKVPMLRKSMPSSSTSSASSGLVTTPKIVPLKRLPPTLKPAPRVQTNVLHKTYPKTPEGTYIVDSMPIISKVQSIERVTELKKTTTPATDEHTESVQTSSPSERKLRLLEAIVIEDEEPEIAKAIDVYESAENLPASTSTANGLIAKNLYVVKDDSAFQYPRILLERILANKRKNDALELEAAKLKRMCIKMNQQIRLQRATTTGETIEIS